MDRAMELDQSFYSRPNVIKEILPFGAGVPIGIECIRHPHLPLGGAYGSWGESYSNQTLEHFLEERWGKPLAESERLNLSELGFLHRHHIPALSDEENRGLEVEVGARFLSSAIQACGWQPEQVEAVLIGMSSPVDEDFTLEIASKAGIRDQALKLSIHKACDSSVAALNMVMNPELAIHQRLGINVAEQLRGKKVLVGGIEGLSRFIMQSRDANAVQLFGNGAGVIGVIPGETMKFLAGASREAYDEEGVLQVHMYYPHTKGFVPGEPLTEVSQEAPNHFRISGLMHEPQSGAPIVMAGPMGMVKLFVRTGVQVVLEAYQAYQRRLMDIGIPGKEMAVAIVHHANYKINQLKEKHLQREGISIPMPWLLKEFGNVSAASNMIAFLRQLSSLNSGDHILIDGFGAGTYYDVLAVEIGT